MSDVVILGAGPAAAGVALALAESGVTPRVIDIGGRLDDQSVAAVQRMRAGPPSGWAAEDRARVTVQPVGSLAEGLPEKRSFGSDYPFRDLGQLSGISAQPGAHRGVVSSAYGGFSNVWGAQVMPFSRATFADWPVDFDVMSPHYSAILNAIPFAGQHDDLAQTFPLLRDPAPLPQLSPRTTWVLDAYERNRASLAAAGVTVGRARLAMDGRQCVRCGLCMTGCPYGLIYSAAHTLDDLAGRGLIRYEPDRLAYRLEEHHGRPRVHLRDLTTGETDVVDADVIFVACGGMGTTRLVATSLGLRGAELQAQESAQFTTPMLSQRPTADPRDEDRFTLNQFNLVLQLDEVGRDLSQIHFYTYNDAFLAALPAVLQTRRTEPAAAQLLRRLTVGIGYLPSWASPRLSLRFEEATRDGLYGMTIRRESPHWAQNRMLRTVVRTLVGTSRRLDLWPVLPKTIVASGGKSYHFGATFPHAADARPGIKSDSLGRVGPWKRIHLVDASVFPTVPATTFTLTVMANAHRIATAVAGS